MSENVFWIFDSGWESFFGEQSIYKMIRMLKHKLITTDKSVQIQKCKLPT